MHRMGRLVAVHGQQAARHVEGCVHQATRFLPEDPRSLDHDWPIPRPTIKPDVRFAKTPYCK